jgi:hypothetical protein
MCKHFAQMIRLRRYIPLSSITPLFGRHGLDPSDMLGESQPNLLFLGLLQFLLCCGLVAICIRIFSLVLGAAEQSLQLVLDRRRLGLGSIGQDCIGSVQ